MVRGDLGRNPLSRIYMGLLTNTEVVYLGPNMEQNAVAVSLRLAHRGQPPVKLLANVRPLTAPPTAKRQLWGQSATKSSITLSLLTVAHGLHLPLPVPVMALTSDFPAILFPRTKAWKEFT